MNKQANPEFDYNRDVSLNKCQEQLDNKLNNLKHKMAPTHLLSEHHKL